ncbi:hypothetical protein LTV02_12990 [Nocardia yamanashiensis]|uniref:hypothetical protein n=1 Tax=Nocardia yamanashiensis TaxID=209247 RepID=UPI001E4299B6|nr:hypothetical protein [Nocardia yamanashiensis]UGT44245.1 hypothetical protein LTV02_12990 [Nocardia yamanashiensis]
MVRISDITALDAWLNEHYEFDDGVPTVVEQSSDGAVTLRFDEYVERGLRPGDVSVVDVYELVAEAPLEFDAPESPQSEHRIEDAQADANGRLVIRLYDGCLVAEAVTVQRVRTERRRTEPWVSDEFTVTTDDRHDDRFWSAAVSTALGAPVVWRMLAAPTPREPGSDIDGCFLQARDRLAETDYGVFCTRHSDGSVTLRPNGDTDPALWRAVRFVAAEFATVRSGNCVFGSHDWVTYLTTGQFPPDERLRGATPSPAAVRSDES